MFTYKLHVVDYQPGIAPTPSHLAVGQDGQRGVL